MNPKNQLMASLILVMAIQWITEPVTAQDEKSSMTRAVFTKLMEKDSILFNAVFTTCNDKVIENMLAGNFVFYQDKGFDAPTAAQPRKEFAEKIRELCASKNGGTGMRMRREIVKASLQVDLISPTEAMQTGIQHFYLLSQDGKEQLVEESKFSRTWQNKNGDWKLARELDYDVNTRTQPANKPGTPNSRYQPETYQPVSAELYNTIAGLDSLYFDTYNTCNLEKMRSMMGDSIEFYHDRGGLTTSLDDFMQSIKNNICGKVTRRPVPGSIEVYPIYNYGAVEIGYHQFFNKSEPGNGFSKPDKYVVIWQQNKEGWKIKRVVSLH